MQVLIANPLSEYAPLIGTALSDLNVDTRITPTQRLAPSRQVLALLLPLCFLLTTECTIPNFADDTRLIAVQTEEPCDRTNASSRLGQLGIAQIFELPNDLDGLIGDLRRHIALTRSQRHEASANGVSPDMPYLDSVRLRILGPAKNVRIAPKVFDLLSYLMRQPGQRFTREQIYRAIYPNSDDELQLRTIDKLISRARKSLRDSGLPFQILSVYRRGYILVTDEHEN